jgi:acyl dehydratase
MKLDHASALTYAVRGDDWSGWVGREIIVEAPYPVEAGRVADFCALVGDANPYYWDPEIATARYGGPVAPPGTLMAWRFPATWNPAGPPAHGPLLALEVPLPVDDLINVTTETTFHAPIRVGSRLTYRERVLSISDEKRTGLGPGYFVTTEFETLDDSGTKVATNRNVMLRFRAEQRSEAGAAAGPAPMEGAHLPELAIPVTATLCTLNVVATKDFFPGHHDGAHARSQGIPDAYPNTLYYQGLVDRVALEWAGYEATVVRRTLTMASPAPIGQTLRTRGKQTARDGDTAELSIEVVTDSALIVRSEVTVAGIR